MTGITIGIIGDLVPPRSLAIWQAIGAQLAAGAGLSGILCVGGHNG
jgi:hypothetical protein